MKTLKLVFAFLSIGLYSYGQKNTKYTVNPEAVELNNKIIQLAIHTDNLDSCRKALAYLDSATTIDSNYFLGYYNKLMFLYPLKQFGKAVSTINNCIRLKPEAHDLYLTGGILYEKVGDTISSKEYFKKSLAILNSVLGTIKVDNLNYEMFETNKAISLIMLGDNKAGKSLLKSIYNKQKEAEPKAMILSYMNKSKKELIEILTSNTGVK